ncbi:hypothetical protein HX071_17480 [Myroides marinus]|uniref:hypothetical protein n=2 Tax=Myroides marinus TaxID=703342 RepID=UPI00257585D7|nr:hypothetical protein [Myroides marinus]MDM1503972.1 hypothetical protein [Myroides marinus]
MVRVDSQGHFRGGLGPLSARLVNGQYVVQTKGKKPKQTEETKKAASDFGYASKNCKIIRLAICEIIYKNHDKDFFRRFTTSARKLLKQNTEYSAGKRTFFNTNMQGLVGFDFNMNSPYREYCTLPIQIQTISNNKVKLNIESFTPHDYFNLAKSTAEIQVDFTLISTHLKEFTSLDTKPFSLKFSENTIVPTQEWEAEIALKDSFTVIIAEIWHTHTTLADKKVVINNNEFHPSSIIYVNNGME